MPEPQTLITKLVPVGGGAELETAEVGTGEPLILVCATSLHLQHWAPLLPALSASRRVIVYNHRGIGASTRGDGTISVASLADDLHALMGALGIERADLMGWSLGSAVLQEFALAYPECARALVMIATWGRTSAFQRAVLAAMRHPWATGELGTALTASAITFSQELVNSEAFGPMIDVMLPWFPSSQSEMAAVVDQWDADLVHDSLDRLGGIVAPTLVVAGQNDVITPAVEGRKVAEAIPGARFELFTAPGASHAVLIERAEECLPLVTGFLDEAAAA
jgi:pimeloyl-ACP methyl ester carboxylesterase